MPIFNVIRLHEYHIVKIRAHRLSLNPEDITTDSSRHRYSNKYIKELADWRLHIRRLNKRKSLESITVEHIYNPI